MPITTCTVTGTFNKQPGVVSTGNLQWQLSNPLFYGGQPVANTDPIPVELSNGAFSVVLWCNDDAPTTPTGTFWMLTGQVDGQQFAQNYVISHVMAPTVDISALTPAATSRPVFPVTFTTVTALPTPGAAYDGKALLVPGNGTTTADVIYVCLMSATGTYSWKQWVTG